MDFEVVMQEYFCVSVPNSGVAFYLISLTGVILLQLVPVRDEHFQLPEEFS